MFPSRSGHRHVASVDLYFLQCTSCRRVTATFGRLATLPWTSLGQPFTTAVALIVKAIVSCRDPMSLADARESLVTTREMLMNDLLRRQEEGSGIFNSDIVGRRIWRRLSRAQIWVGIICRVFKG